MNLIVSMGEFIKQHLLSVKFFNQSFICYNNNYTCITIDLHLTISQSFVLLAEDSSDDDIAGQFDLCVSTAQSLQRNATVSVSTEDRTAKGILCHLPPSLLL